MASALQQVQTFFFFLSFQNRKPDLTLSTLSLDSFLHTLDPKNERTPKFLLGEREASDTLGVPDRA